MMSISPAIVGPSVPTVESADQVVDYLNRHTKNLLVVLAKRLQIECNVNTEALAATHASDDALYYELKRHEETKDQAAELQGVRMLRVLYNNARSGKHGHEGAVILPRDDPFMRQVDQEMYRYIDHFVETETGLAIPEYEELSLKHTMICKIGSYAVERGGDEGTPFVFYATSAAQA